MRPNQVAVTVSRNNGPCIVGDEMLLVSPDGRDLVN